MQRSACTEFLQGQMTSPAVVQSIKEALRKGEEKHFEILYYRKNGKCADEAGDLMLLIRNSRPMSYSFVGDDCMNVMKMRFKHSSD